MKSVSKISFNLCALGVIILSVMGLLGYLPGLELLASIHKDYIPMAPATAIGFLILGGILPALNTKPLSRTRTVVLSVLTFMVSLFGLMEMAGHMMGMDLVFEQALVPVSSFHDGIPVGRMSPVTGICFLLSGMALGCLILHQGPSPPGKRIEYIGGSLAVLVLTISFVFCLAYFHGSPLLYGYTSLIPMALTTALGFLLLSLGILISRRDGFPMRIFAENSTRAYLLRFMVPLSILSVMLGGLTASSFIEWLKINPAIISAALTVLMAIFTGLAAIFISRHMGRLIDRQNEIIKRSRQALSRQEEEYRILFETMAQGVVYQNADGEILTANPAAQHILGLSLDQMKGRTSKDPRWKAVDKNKKELPGDRHPAMVALKTKKIVKDFIQGVFNPKHNDYVWILVNSVPQFKEGEDEPYQVYSTFLDITESRQTEAVRDMLMAAIEQSGEMVIITSPEGIIQYVNQAFEKVSGYTRQEVIGQNPRILKSGRQDEAFYHQLRATLSKGNTFKGRMVNKRKDGSFYTEDAAISPVCNASGAIVNYVAVNRDITEQILLEAQFQQAQKMESVGRLAGGVAHDFNNMLTIIISYTQMLINQTTASDPIHNDLEQILKAAQRSTDITRQLLAFARKQTINPKYLNVNDAVESTLKMLRRLIGEDIDLSWNPESGLWPVMADPSQIDQVLANLCVNARDAIRSVGKITIETDNISFDNAYCAEHPGFVPGDFVLLAVSDDGCGMDKPTLERLFEPFFTTKGLGQGTGLGLATVYGIVKQNNGFINVYSEPEKGTTFRIYLPRYTGEAGEIRPKEAVEIRMGRGETVLIVEDEASILKLGKRILMELGYTVLAAATPGQAMETAKTHEGDIHLIITDVVMPEMNGRDLSRQIQNFYPDIKVLFMSGYTADVIAHQGVLDRGVHFLQKPFSNKDMAAKIREVLDARD
ncbi:MAG: PAS domain S-box protein [Desulfobacula sp.]|nr:PAS domain S-box protein [Desulfobacula sp.]